MSEPAGLLICRIAIQWLMLAAMLVVFGMAAFAVVMARAGIEAQALPRRFSAVIRLAAFAQLAILPMVMVVNVACMAEVELGAAIPLIPQVLRETHFGHLWLALAPLAVLLALAAWCPSRLDPLRAGCLTLTSAATLLLWAASGHAADYGKLAIAVDFIHEAAVGLWIGALIGLWLAADLGESAIQSAASRTSRVAAWCVVTLTLSGAYAAYSALGLSLHRLVYSRYGITLLCKAALFAVVVALGGYNRRWLVPALETASRQRALVRNVALESALLLAILGLATLLSNTALPRRMGSHAGRGGRRAVVSVEARRRPR